MNVTAALLLARLRELRKEERIRVLDDAFPNQTRFIEDDAKLKALFCTRRAAKSYTGGLGLIQTAINYDKVNCLFLGLTRLSAKGIIWKDILKEINTKHGLGIKFNGSELTATLPNESVIYVTGVDADSDEMKKLLGKKYKLVILDEASMYSVDMRLLIYGILKPMVIDQGGAIWVLGTASNLTSGLFYDITKGIEPGWKLFQWSAHDNPYVAKQWQDELDDIKKNRPLFMETSLYQQWYLNQWVIDEDAKVYKYNANKNSAQTLPTTVEKWNYVLGLDLAHSPDSTAFVIGAYNVESPNLYIVYADKATGLDITDVGVRVRLLDRKYQFEFKIVDGANKQAVAELNNRHNLNLTPADKTGKVDFITLMNDDLIQGKVLLTPDAKALATEYEQLIWLTDSNGKVKTPKTENPLIHNDCSDAALYLWRYCYQYLFSPKSEPLDHSKQEVWEPLHIQKLQDQVKREQNPYHMELDKIEEWDKENEGMEI